MYPNNYVVTINPDNVLNEIYESYKGKTPEFAHNLVNGFRVDFPRMHFTYNNCLITDMNTYHDIIYDHENLECSTMFPNMYIVLLLLSTQASFFNSYSVIHAAYSDPNNDIFVVQTRSCPKISIYSTPTEIRVYIKKSYQTINTTTGSIHSVYHTCMLMKFENNDNTWYPAICMIYWLIEPKVTN